MTKPHFVTDHTVIFTITVWIIITIFFAEGPALVNLTISRSDVDEGSTFDVLAEVLYAGIIRNLTLYFPLIPTFPVVAGFLPGKPKPTWLSRLLTVNWMGNARLKTAVHTGK